MLTAASSLAPSPPPPSDSPMWLSSMWTMSSARDSNWRPQPPNLQELEKKEAAAMPVMFAPLVHSPGGERGGTGSRGGDRRRRQSFRVQGSGRAAELGAAEQTPGGQTGQRRAQLGCRRAGGGGDGGRRMVGGWQATSRPAYLLGPWISSDCDIIINIDDNYHTKLNQSLIVAYTW